MPELISEVENLQVYLNGVINRADHHAQNVNTVVLSIIGAVIAKSTGEIKVRTYGGTPANSLWFEVNSNRYVLKYDHENQQIVLLERTERGNVLNSFTNNDSAADIWQVFRNL